MRELSLFSGAGGGLLATKHLLGWTTIGYVEYEPYCQKVLKARIADGYLDAAPIFGDIREFIKGGYAESYQVMVDVVTAGFPCQPFSVAGKQKGKDDERNMWPATRDTIRCVRPRYAFLENVPGLLNSGYFSTILSDLYEIGYDARWTVLGAHHVGAPHKRDRLWIMANTKRSLCDGRSDESGRKEKKRTTLDGGGEGLAYSKHHGRSGILRETRQGEDGTELRTDFDGEGFGVRWVGAPRQAVADSNKRRSQSGGDKTRRKAGSIPDRSSKGTSMANTPKEGFGDVQGQRSSTGPSRGEELRANRWWNAEPALGRVAHGVAHRVDRLKAIGNGQVSQVAALAWKVLEGGDK